VASATVKTPSKSVLAYEHIAERIGDGRYSPGFRLVLDPIAQELGVSVVPVREAIRRLEAEGLVTFEHNVGAQVALVHEDEYVITMQTLSIVEGAATGLAAPHVTAADIARARAINAEMIESLDHFDPVRFTQLNLDFHSVLFDRCPNPHVVDLVHRGWARLKLLRESTFSFVPGRAKGSVDEHEALLRLIEQHADPLDIELAARRHRTTTMDAYLASRHH
jgi:DNA-binding GntR family transcriptional regulator